MLPRFRLDRRPPFALASLALAVFVLGSNYCLVSMVARGSGSRSLECHAASVAEPARDCCHRAPPSPHREAPEVPDRSPCCILLAPPSTLQIDKSLAVDRVAPAVALAAEIAPLAPAPSWHGLTRDRASESPPPLPRAALGSRAPPLA